MKNLLSATSLSFLAILGMPMYLIRINFFGLPSNVFEIIVLLIAAVFVAGERNAVAKKLRSVPNLFLFGILLILIGVFLSILFNDNYRAGFGIFKSWFVIPMFFSFALYTKIDSEKFVEKIFLAIFLSSALVGIIGIVYKIKGFVTFDNRLSAFYLSPNHLAMYLAPGIFFGFYFVLKYFINKKYQKLLFVIISLLAIIFASLYFTYSYGAWIAIFVSLLITMLVALPNRKKFLAVIFIAFAIIVFLLQTGTQKFLNLSRFPERSSLSSRETIWNASLLMVKQNPVLGIGPGNFQEKYLSLQKYFPPYLEWAVPQPHNVFFAFWLQAGILGLAGFLFLLYFIFHSFYIIIKNEKSASFAAPLFGFFIYTVLHGMIDTPYWKNDLSFLFWICVFLVLYLYKYSSSK